MSMLDDLRDIAVEIGPSTDAPTRLRTGTVVSVGTGVATVEIAGTEVPNIPVATSMSLAAGQSVDVTLDGPSPRIGSISSGVSGATVYDVRAFGAVGDGTTDDAAAIQAAHDALPSTGGVVYFPAAVSAYLLASAVTVSKPNVTFLGAHRDLSIIKGALSGGLLLVNADGFRCESLTVYQTYAGATAHTIIYVSASDAEFFNCRIKTDGSAAASSAYVMNTGSTPGTEHDLTIRNSIIENLASLTSVQVSGIIWRHSGLTLVNNTWRNINNPIVPETMVNKQRLSYCLNNELADQLSVHVEGPDICNWSNGKVIGNSQFNTLVSGSTVSQGGLLIESGGPSDFAGVSQDMVIAGNSIRGGPMFLVCDMNSSNAAQVHRVAFTGNTVNKVRSSLPNSFEITGPETPGNATNVIVANNVLPDGVRYPGTAVGTWLTVKDNPGAESGYPVPEEAEVLTAQTTTSTSYTDLTTAGPAVTVEVPPSGRVKVTVSARLWNTAAGGSAFVACALSGANTVAEDNAKALYDSVAVAGALRQGSYSYLLTGLTRGQTTFTAKYRAASGTASFSNRRITVEPMP